MGRGGYRIATATIGAVVLALNATAATGRLSLQSAGYTAHKHLGLKQDYSVSASFVVPVLICA
jgi:hypothetical protein